VLVVDDAHLLDPESAALVHHLAVRHEARLVVTVRDGEPAPDAVVALWKDDLLRRLEVPPLAHEDLARVLRSALSGHVEARAVRRLTAVAGGDLRMVEELVLAGTLTRKDGVWGWRGDPAVNGRVRELVANRLGELDAAEWDALTYLAFGAPLKPGTLARLAGPETVERLEARGLLTCAGGAPYAEVIRAMCGPVRAMRVQRTLAEAEPGDPRAALWRLDGGLPGDPEALTTACRTAMAALDVPLAVRLARAATAAGADENALAAALGHPPVTHPTTAGTPGVDPPNAPLAPSDGSSPDHRDPPAAGHPTGTLGMEPRNATLERPDARPGDTGPQPAHQAPPALRPGHATTTTGAGRNEPAASLGRPHDAPAGEAAGGSRTTTGAAHMNPPNATLEPPDDRLGDTDPHASRQAPPALRPGRATEAVEAGHDARAGTLGRPYEPSGGDATSSEASGGGRRSATAEGGRPPAVRLGRAAGARAAVLGLEDPRGPHGGAGRRLRDEHVRLTAAVLAGDLTAEPLLGADAGWDVAAAAYCGERARLHRLRGEVRQALACGRDGVWRLPGGPAAFAGQCLGELAHAAALLGDAAAARRALAEAEERTPSALRHVETAAELAAPWAEAAAGEQAAAVRRALAAADRAEDAEVLLFSLHSAVRLDAAEAVAERLRRLADAARPDAAPVDAVTTGTRANAAHVSATPTDTTVRDASPGNPTPPHAALAGVAVANASNGASVSPTFADATSTNATSVSATFANTTSANTTSPDATSANATSVSAASADAATAGGALAGLFARHAEACVREDGGALQAVAREFEGLGLTLYAAEAQAQAARAYRRAGEHRRAKAAAAAGWTLSLRCEGARTPALAELTAPELTLRQLEIARLAAAGLSNRAIAERLTVSIRTVANHLCGAYERLGVNDRDGLARLLAGLERRVA
jgi:DNA-binding CsgD family transcriptional regulator